MEFTTHFELHSQTTRLVEGATHGSGNRLDGVLTLYDVPFQGTYTYTFTEASSTNYNSDPQGESDFKFEQLPLHSPLLRQSLLVSFPPLIDMLKFSGYPHLIRGQTFVNLSGHITISPQSECVSLLRWGCG